MFKTLPIFFGFFLFSFVIARVNAQTVNVVVYVADIPHFTYGPLEDPESSVGLPTNAGEKIIFNAQAYDPESPSYYFIVCKTDEIISNAGHPPSCPQGMWCMSELTENGNNAKCEYMARIDDSEENDWFAFLCSFGTGYCSDSYQGSGSQGSPFYVNHPPEFISVTNNGSDYPSGLIVWSVKSFDPDVIGGRDRTKIFVCSSPSFSNGRCSDGVYCESELSSNNPTCSYRIPDIEKDNLHKAYVFLVDEHGMESQSSLQGVESSFGVNNIYPETMSLVLNQGRDINLFPNTKTLVKVTATVSDRNSCSQDEIKSVTASLYRSSVGYQGCKSIYQANNNYCYPSISCSLVEGELCEHPKDATLNYQCDIEVWYYADPTDKGTFFSTDDWKATLRVEDDNGFVSEREVSIGVEMNSLISFDLDSGIEYGELNIGQVIDPLSKETKIRSFSNVGLDAILYGTDLVNAGEYKISVENQRYALSKICFWDAFPLGKGMKYFDLDLKKPTKTFREKSIYWGIKVPENTVAGIYSGSNYLIAVKGDVSGW